MEAEAIRLKFEGLLLGMAVGDALGLPGEQLHPKRARLLLGEPPLEHAFLFGKGMCSDDTEHLCMTSQALLKHPDDEEHFIRDLAWRLRAWFLLFPAGMGFATLRSMCKLWLGFSPRRSGVFSAGNGPAMRAPVLGAFLSKDISLMKSFVKASTVISHTHPQAFDGALTIALAARHSFLSSPEELDRDAFFEVLFAHLEVSENIELMKKVQAHLEIESTPEALAQALGLERGVSGYINHTVPMCIFCWLRFPSDFRKALEAMILLGGDTDTTGGILGALVGAHLGADAIPDSWVNGIAEYPRSVSWLRRLATALAENDNGSNQRQHDSVRLSWWVLPFRNVFFLAVVLFHGFRRLFPPYGK